MDMNNLLLPIVLGIITSLVATAIFIGLAEIIRRLVFPWVEDKIYRGVRVDGTWKLHSNGGIPINDNTTIEMEIKQWGDKISGTCFTLSSDDKTIYVIKGVLKNMYLMAYMEPTSSKMIDASAFLFHIEHEKNSLRLKGSLLHKNLPGKVSCWEELIFVQRTI